MLKQEICLKVLSQLFSEFIGKVMRSLDGFDAETWAMENVKILFRNRLPRPQHLFEVSDGESPDARNSVEHLNILLYEYVKCCIFN